MSDKYKKARFEETTKLHRLTVLKDDGVYRHMRYAAPGTANRAIQITTFPGHLVFTGDMGDWVFERTEDMFEFFRGGRINPDYWSEKVQAGEFERYSTEKFRDSVKSSFDSFIDDNHELSGSEAADELWSAIESEVLGVAEDAEKSEDIAYQAADSFVHAFSAENSGLPDFYFVDFWEFNLKDFTTHFLWACYAIVEVIRLYDDLEPVGVQS